MKKLLCLAAILLCIMTGCGTQPSVSSEMTPQTTLSHTKSTSEKTTAIKKKTSTTKKTTAAAKQTTATKGTTATTAAKTTEKAPTTQKVGDDMADAVIEEPLEKIVCTVNHAALQSEGENVERFIFFTDQHSAHLGQWQDATRRVFDKMKEYERTLSPAFIVSGGDWLGSEDTPAVALEKLDFIRLQADRFANFHLVLGNHDTNYQGCVYEGDDAYSSGPLDNEVIAEIWYPEHKRNYYRFESEKASNYILDSQTDGISVDTVRYIIKQIHWLAEDLTKNNAAHINVFVHIGTPGPTVYLPDELARTIRAYNERVVYNYQGKTYDFSKKNGRIDLVFSGHLHAERSFKLGGAASIVCTGNAYSDTPLAHHCTIDYDSGLVHVVRQDGGESRCFPF